MIHLTEAGVSGWFVFGAWSYNFFVCFRTSEDAGCEVDCRLGLGMSMRGMTTNDIMNVALELAGFTEVPGDSAIYVEGSGIRKVLFGIDITTAELKIAKDLGYDCVIAHHPVPGGPSWKVYERHIDFMVSAGVPHEVAAAAVLPRIEAMKASGHSANYDHTPSVARLLCMPFMNIHGPLDEIGRRILQKKADDLLASMSRPRVRDLMAAFAEIPEIKNAKTDVVLAAGNPDAEVRRVVVAHGALTNGGYEVANAYFTYGVDTVVYIHIAPDAGTRLAKEGKGNLIVTGHIASDSIGINPFIDELRARGLEVDTISGVISRD